MQDTRIAAVSMNGGLGDPQGVLEGIQDFCQQARQQQAQLVLFPELVIHGHCTPNTWDLAEPVPAGPSVQKLCELAREFGLVISAGLSEKESDLVYNTQVVVTPNGYLGKQRKLHLSRDEGNFYKGGRDVPVFDVGPCRVGIVICYDNQFPEVARLVALHGADVILMPHAARESQWEDTPESQAAARQHMYDFYCSCYAMRARENACFCVVADQAGRAGYVPDLPRDHHNQPHHPGAALVFDPLGNLAAATQVREIRDEMIVVDLPAEQLAKARSHPNYTLKTRRPELFHDLVAES